MSTKNKLEKFSELATFPNVYQNYHVREAVLENYRGEVVEQRGQWHAHFGNTNPITLELACGRGEYTVALAERFAHRNFIGIDVKGARIWRGAQRALERGLHNAAFLRTRIEILPQFIGQGEVAEIWITFPDPFLERGKSGRRLTAPQFLSQYRRLLSPNGLLHLKTDSPELYDFTLHALARTPSTILYHHPDIYAEPPLYCEELDITTYYERMHLAEGRKIKYIRFQLHPE